jgi:heme/copper-type cytochrome/quinol oxidase subunit 4
MWLSKGYTVKCIFGVARMKTLEKVDILCIGFMVAIVLTACAFWAITAGLIWWVIVGIVIVSLILIGITSRKRYH